MHPGRRTRLRHTSAAPGTYDAAVSIPGELERARRLAFAADESGARDLLLSLMPRIEREDRDDLMLEVFAQLGESCLARGAIDGVHESIRRIRDCLAIYSAIAAGAVREAAGRVRMSDAEVAHMIRRYSRRMQFLQTALAAALGDHEGAAAALRNRRTRIPATNSPISPTNTHTCAATRKRCARPRCATTTCTLSQFPCGSGCSAASKPSVANSPTTSG